MGSKKRKKYMTPEEREYQGFKVPDKTDYKESALNPNREIKQEIAREQSYIERPQQQTYKSPGQQNIPQQRSQQVYYHSQENQEYSGQDHQLKGAARSAQNREESRRREEMLDTVRFDGDIDLDKEKSREQLGFKDNKTYPASERDSFSRKIKKQGPKYGTVEGTSSETQNLAGPAGPAVIAGNAQVFKTDNRSVFAESIIKPVSMKDSIAEDIKERKIEVGSKSSIDLKNTKKKGPISKGAYALGRKIEGHIDQWGSYGDVQDRAKGKAAKYGYRVGKYSALAGFTIAKGTLRHGRKGISLAADVSRNIFTTSQAKNLFKSGLKTSLAESGKSVGKMIKTGAVNAIVDFKGSDDLGMKAITAPKDVVVKGHRAFKTTRAFARTSVKVTKTAYRLTVIMKNIAKKILTNPMVIKTVLIAAIVGLLIAFLILIITVVAGIIPTISLKSEKYEMTKTYLYITELDALIEGNIKVLEDLNIGQLEEVTGIEIPEEIEAYKYYVNGESAIKDEIKVETDADSILTYLDSKYEDYSFNSIIDGIFGTTIKSEIDKIHEELYQLEYEVEVEEVETRVQHYNPITGEVVVIIYIDEKLCLNTYLEAEPWESYYTDNKDILLAEDEQEMYNSLKEVGIYTFQTEFNSPFPGVEWNLHKSSRWGWRVHPISKEVKMHNGIDIAMPRGTPIYACHAGTIETGNEPEGLGRWIKIIQENGDYTLYGHLNTVSVYRGQTVNPGHLIGYVGSTGQSTGDHLHLEVYIDGKNHLPDLLIECDNN